MTQRYQPNQESNGTWTPIDTRTERPAEMGSRTIAGLNRHDAEELANLLNMLETRRQRVDHAANYPAETNLIDCVAKNV